MREGRFWAETGYFFRASYGPIQREWVSSEGRKRFALNPGLMPLAWKIVQNKNLPKRGERELRWLA
jgi:hypothetical protein